MTVEFTATVRRWREDQPGGLSVVDIPDDLVTPLGGRRQMRVTGTLNNSSFTGSTMLVAGGGRRRAACPGRPPPRRPPWPKSSRHPAKRVPPPW
jgi:hypothetical protein